MSALVVEIATPTPRAIPAPGTKLGPYELVHRLGSGSMASVHLARTRASWGFDRLVSIKVLHPELARQPSFVRMFMDEARITASISHPNVVSILDIGEAEGLPYFAMEYVRGETLEAFSHAVDPSSRRIPFDLAAWIIASLCDGLHAAHELTDPEGLAMALVHCDVSPRNILLGYDGVPRIFDFGVAYARDIALESRDVLRGTLAYMAPEQFNFAALDRRTDVFALGVNLWELSVGRKLFPETGSSDIAKLILTAKERRVPPPSECVPDFPAELESVVLRALEVDPKARFPSARALAEALRGYLGKTSSTAAAPVVGDLLKSRMAGQFERRVQDERSALGDRPRVSKTDGHEAKSAIDDVDALPWCSVIPIPLEESLSIRPLKRRSGGGVLRLAGALATAAVIAWFALEPSQVLDPRAHEAVAMVRSEIASVSSPQPRLRTIERSKSAAPTKRVEVARAISRRPILTASRSRPHPTERRRRHPFLFGGADL
jgi:eukaryotic-like serine/threonine-protein kinase